MYLGQQKLLVLKILRCNIQIILRNLVLLKTINILARLISYGS
jgi:hypothetical protein